jgi:hypothetical protein
VVTKEDSFWRRFSHLNPQWKRGRPMPNSANVFDEVVKEMLRACEPTAVLDIGPGEGKYGRMVAGLAAETGRSILKTCVEIDGPKIIERFNLRALYDEVICEDAANLPRKRPTLTGDVVLCGDMIEHLPKSQGADLIEFLQYRFRHLFLVIPVDWLSLEYEDYEHEAHVSIWRPADIARFHGASCVQRVTSDGHTFILAAINSILIPERDFFIVRDQVEHPGRPSGNGEEHAGIEFGYLNRLAHRPVAASAPPPRELRYRLADQLNAAIKRAPWVHSLLKATIGKR